MFLWYSFYSENSFLLFVCTLCGDLNSVTSTFEVYTLQSRFNIIFQIKRKRGGGTRAEQGLDILKLLLNCCTFKALSLAQKFPFVWVGSYLCHGALNLAHIAWLLVNNNKYFLFILILFILRLNTVKTTQYLVTVIYR